MVKGKLSSTSRGNSFRDAVSAFMAAAGYETSTEVLVAGKVVDLLAERKAQLRQEKIAFETKDYSGSFPKSEVLEFISEYSTLLQHSHVTQAILVTREGITPHGKQAIDASSTSGNLLHLTWASLQREVFGPEPYLKAL